MKDRFTQSSDEVVDMLESMLEFNPMFRNSAKECLKNEMFDDIRVKELEQGAPFEIELACDEMDAYDYSTDQDHFCGTVKEYKKLIINEIDQM